MKASPTTILAILVVVITIRSFTLLPANEPIHGNHLPLQQPLPTLHSNQLRNQTMVFVHVGKFRKYEGANELMSDM